MAAKRSQKTRKTARKTRRKTDKKAKKRSTKRKRPTKSPSVKHDVDLGTLALRPYVNAKRKAKHEEIKEYERKFLSR